MPNARANRGDRKPTPEPDAPLRFVSLGAQRRSAALHPVAGPRVPTWDDQVLQQELEQLIAERLDDASDIAISVHGGCALLHGRVSCSLASLLAEDLVFSIPEIDECHNELVVKPKGGASLAA